MSLDVKRQYDFGVVVPFKRYIKYRFEEINKNVINLKINAPCKSLSHVLIFAIDPNDRKDWSRKEVFKNLDIKSVNVAVEGKQPALYFRTDDTVHVRPDSQVLQPQYDSYDWRVSHE